MIGQTFSHYKILQKLGEGGMGVVYKAQDTKLLRPVALKFLSPELTRDQDAKKRFIREARAASGLDHPNIAVVHDVDETPDGHSFICMAYYDGETLATKLSKGSLDVADAARVALQIAGGLESAHDSGIVHRDIKPSNIIVTPQGEVKIVDFGLAKLSEQARETKTQITGGTAAYMSPEQILGNEADARSDLFSLGVVLYETVTAKRPFLGDHEAALYYSIVNSEPIPPSTIRSGVSPELERIILRLLEKDPNKRYQSASDVVVDLKHVLGEKPTARPVRQLRRALSGKYPVSVVVGAVVIVATLILYVSGALQHWFGTNPPLPEQVSIAVLPFEIRGADSIITSQFQGLFETIAIRLTKLRAGRSNINVIATSMSKDFKSAKDAYEKSGATVALKCSFEYAAPRTQIKVSLENTRTLRTIDGDILHHNAKDLVEIESDILMFVVGTCRIDARSSDLRGFDFGDTKNDEANRLNLQARGELRNYTNGVRLRNSIDLFRKALALDPTFTLAYAGLGEAYWRNYEMTRDPQWVDSAESAWRLANALNQKLPEVHLVRGVLYRVSGKYPAAIEEFRVVLSMDSLNADAYRELGDAYAKSMQPLKAEEAYKKAIAIRPKDWTVYNYLARFYFGTMRTEEAIELWKKVIELAPDVRIGYNNLGVAYFMRLERWRDAISSFEQAQQIDSSNYVTYQNLGAAYYYDGLYERSAQAYEKSLRLNPKDCGVLGGLGAAYRAMGSQKLSHEAYEEAVKLAEGQLKVNPNDAELSSQLAGFYADVGRKQDARSMALKALLLAPDDRIVLQRLVFTYELLGDRQQAIKMLSQAVKQKAQLTEIKYSPEMKILREDPRYKQITKGG
jgi:eukaryotic-like serine/threonine-protein kinase